MSFPKRGEIYQVDLEPTIGYEMKKKRPALIVSNDFSNEHTPLIIVCPITSTIIISPVHIHVERGEAGLTKSGIIHCGQIRAIDKTRLSHKIGILSQTKMHHVDKGLAISLALY